MPTPCGHPDCRACWGMYERGLISDVEMESAMAELKGRRSAKPKEQAAIAKQVTAATAALPHITAFPELVDVLPDLVEEYRGLLDQEANIKARKEELGPELMALLEAVEQKSIRGNNWVVSRADGAWQSKITAEGLLAQGVTMDQIDAATERKQSRGYVQVKRLES